MLIGLLHLHRSLAYLLFLGALIVVGLSVARGRTDPRVAGTLDWVVRYGITWGGRVTAVIGAVMWAFISTYGVGTWWLWVSLLLWGPVEVLGKRLILPETELVRDGGQATGRLVLGAVGQLLLISVIFGLMSARP